MEAVSRKRDLASIASLTDFIKSQFGKLDILVNNAGIPGVIADADALELQILESVEEGAAGPTRLALLPNGGPSDLSFKQMEEQEF
ncbi:hypothetical protein SLEP1_g24163 [Rubroshorea leprosula]|uniref:Uncharacterized protein n=1 Tax=Rubroshorea leprosula TaxID=152421 RepID=A0AAV5JKZ6_9ROSI|nr:hypothetical protein SLEP1_g24163 [Rubroshorea leprosula]